MKEVTSPPAAQRRLTRKAETQPPAAGELDPNISSRYARLGFWGGAISAPTLLGAVIRLRRGRIGSLGSPRGPPFSAMFWKSAAASKPLIRQLPGAKFGSPESSQHGSH